MKLVIEKLRKDTAEDLQQGGIEAVRTRIAAEKAAFKAISATTSSHETHDTLKLHEAIAHLEGHVDELQQKLVAREDEIAKLKLNILHLEEQLSKNATDALKLHKSESMRQLSEAQAQIAELTRQLHEVKDRLDEAVHAPQNDAEKTALETRIKDINDQLDIAIGGLIDTLEALQSAYESGNADRIKDVGTHSKERMLNEISPALEKLETLLAK